MWCLVYYHYYTKATDGMVMYKDQFGGYLFYIVIDYGLDVI
jgi:hypothetical protein